MLFGILLISSLVQRLVLRRNLRVTRELTPKNHIPHLTDSIDFSLAAVTL